MTCRNASVFFLVVLLFTTNMGFTQEYGQPDQDQPGDAMILEYLRRDLDRSADKSHGFKRSATLERPSRLRHS